MDQLECRVRELIGELTGTASADLDLSMPVTQFGVDSLMSQALIAWADENYQLQMEQSDVFGGLTMNGLMDKINKLT